MSKIEVKSSCLIPTATNSLSMPRMDLTPWDLQFLLLDPIQKGILFYKPESHHQLQLETTIVDHLKNSLSRTLDFFPPLAGRLSSVKNDDNTTSFFVDCNNAGAEFTHSVAGDVSISDILEPKYIPAEIVSSLFPLNGIPNIEGVSKPSLGVQITELADGFFIGCTCNHAVVDGTSFWHFFNSWSEMSRGFDATSKTPVFERSFCRNIIRIDDELIVSNLPSWEKKHLLERVFHFSKESVAKLKAKANSEAGSDNKISSLQALSAHLWRSVIRCRKNIHNVSSQEVFFTLLVGTRTRIPLPEGYFGNAVYGAGTAISETEMLQNGLGYAATKINELVEKQTGEEAKRFVEDWVRNPAIIRKGRIDFIISSSPRHNVYGCDFGWGKPIAVRSGKGQKFDGKMTLFPAAVAGGIDVEVCLAHEIMRAMENDGEFMEAVISTS